MDDFLAARSQMALSLGFHIIYACIGMVMPFFMAVSHYRWLKTNDIVYKNLTKAWSKGVAIFFATGAVSGTVLSFELGLLWPTFMKHAGPIFGMPFSLDYRCCGRSEWPCFRNFSRIGKCLDEQSGGI